MLFDDEGSKARARASLDMAAVWQATGYLHEQSSMPETLGFALSDSPVGLAAWIIEKFQAWSDPDRFIEEKFSRDDLLTNVMIYWLTSTITSSMRLYKETFSSMEVFAISLQPVVVPVALSLFPYEIFPPTDISIRRQFTNILHFSKHQRGGHFAALEEPDKLTEDLLIFIGKLQM